MEQQTTAKVEFNSNTIVITRVNQIIEAINLTRFNLTNPFINPSDKTRVRDLTGHLIALWKEIFVELTDKEAELWEEIKTIRDEVDIKEKVLDPRNSSTEVQFNQVYFRRMINRFDELDLKVRLLAKKHEFLSSNKDDPRSAVLRS